MDTEKTYRVVGTCRLSGQPVNWNARAICWSGDDTLAPLRRVLRHLGWRLPQNFKVHRWLLATTDDRRDDYRCRYGRSVEVARRILNTGEDVEARAAGNLAEHYWDAKERTGQRPDLADMASKA